MPKCYLCEDELNNKNKSLEHIIPNALGGKLKAYILCRDCNNEMGKTIDSNLISNFMPFNILANPNRDRKTIQKIETKIYGQEVSVGIGNKIKSHFQPKSIKDGDKTQIQISGLFTDEKDEKKFLKQAQKYIQGKFKDKLGKIQPQITKEEIKRPPIPINFEIHFNDLLLGYLKILLGFCALKDKIQYICPNIIDFFKKQDIQNIENIAVFCNNTKFLECGRLCHFICLIAQQKQKKLFGIVSLYGKFSFIFTLNDNYQGGNFIEHYHYDILNSKKLTSSLNMEKMHFETCYSNAKLSFETMTKSVTEAIKYFMQFFIVKADDAEFGSIVYQLIQFIAIMETECLNQENLKNYFIKSFFKAREQNMFLFLKDAEIEELGNMATKKEFYSFYKKKYIEIINIFDLLNKQCVDIISLLKDNGVPQNQIKKSIFHTILAENIWVKIIT